MSEAKPINMVLLGAPGAGKGTQADILVKAYNLVHISTGAMLRDAVSGESEVGKKVKSFMDSGALVPDEVVNEVVKERLSKPDTKKGFILDGYPRTAEQADALQDILKELSIDLDFVLYFGVAEETAVTRLSGRRVCTTCGKNYHVTNMPPKKEGICDKCGIDLIQRDDDKPDTIKNRLKVYEASTKGLIDYYKSNGLLRELDANVTASELFEEIDSLFKKEGVINDDSDKK